MVTGWVPTPFVLTSPEMLTVEGGLLPIEPPCSRKIAKRTIIITMMITTMMFLLERGFCTGGAVVKLCFL